MCKKCFVEYPLSTEFFYADKSQRDGLSRYCKLCNADKANKAYHKNIEQRREYARTYQRNNPDKVKANHARYIAKNPETYRKRLKEYQKNNPHIIRAATQRRRARLLGAVGTHTGSEIRAQYKRQRGACYYCGVEVGKEYHVDHVVPLSRGGTNDISNLVIACPTCNHKKHARLPHEFSEGGRLL